MTDKWKNFLGWDYLFFGDPNEYTTDSGYCLDFVLEGVGVSGFIGAGRLYCKEAVGNGQFTNYYVARDDRNDPTSSKIQKNAFVEDKDYMKAHDDYSTNIKITAR